MAPARVARPIPPATLSPRHLVSFRKRLIERPQGCVEWTGTQRNGYGVLFIEGVCHNAHRVAFRLGGGELTPDKPCVLHACDNKLCCNFAHLFAGTRQENMTDMARKRRGRGSGVRNFPYGVFLQPGKVDRFGAKLRVNGSERYLGTFDTVEEAAAVAAAERERLYGRFHSSKDSGLVVAEPENGDDGGTDDREGGR